ncbi:signal peptidase II Aspartic peptidase. MEROPS family A08 [Verrucomicrobium sp. GAS474]|uniref:signal peptidase II n=1 Tax=Verrucomicrobium sp. GAS474 TaxID=1882831 RepID=UPI00087BFEFB|nr:signal peptidase II [Verrucomicrobium sp. GAS474]SDU29958.1 signal peptidase II Aspartic peptidase. MEROPS family A08 [Verrucomicrobium sp. GAS474]
MTPEPARTSPRPLFYVAALLLLALDQATKAWALANFVVRDREVIPDWLNLTLAWNTGIAFSLFRGNNGWLLAIVGLFIAVGLFYARKIDWRPRETNLLFALLLAGAFGNLVDRVRHGAVVDFIDVHAGVHHWPTFNVADSCITVGAGILVFQALFPPVRPPAKKS